MSNDILDDLLDVIHQRISEPETPTRSRAKKAVGAGAALVILAGTVLAASQLAGPAPIDVSTETPDTTQGSAPAASGIPPLPTPKYVFGADNEPLYQMSDMLWGPSAGPTVQYFRLAGTDSRLTPMSLSEFAGPDVGESTTVGQVGDREISTPKGLTYPAGADPSRPTGPYFWTEPDGTRWIAGGYLEDILRALPDIEYSDGRHRFVRGVVPVDPPPQKSSPSVILRSERFLLSVHSDTRTDFTLVDPRAERFELIQVAGKPGARTSVGISWRLDPDTVIDLQPDPFMLGQIELGEILATAETVRVATAAELARIRPFRGTFDERIIVTVPADTRLEEVTKHPVTGDVATTPASVSVVDLDAGSTVPTVSFSTTSASWLRDGFALPIGDELTGHRLRLQLRPPATWDDRVTGPCVAETTVPPKGQPPVTLQLAPCE